MTCSPGGDAVGKTTNAKWQAKDTTMRSALPPKLAAALGEKPRAAASPGPESTTQVSEIATEMFIYIEREGRGGGRKREGRE